MQIQEEDEENPPHSENLEVLNTTNAQWQQSDSKPSNVPTTYDSQLRPLEQIPEFPNEPAPSTFNTVTQTRSDKHINPTQTISPGLQIVPPNQLVHLESRDTSPTADNKMQILEEGPDQPKRQPQSISS